MSPNGAGWGESVERSAGMLGFELGFWDYVTFASLLILGAALVVILVLIGGLPGRIGIGRNHPDAEAVKIMGWASYYRCGFTDSSAPMGRPLSAIDALARYSRRTRARR